MPRQVALLSVPTGYSVQGPVRYTKPGSPTIVANFGVITNGAGGQVLTMVGVEPEFADPGSGPFVVPNVTSDPGSPVTGEMWFRTDL